MYIAVHARNRAVRTVRPPVGNTRRSRWNRARRESAIASSESTNPTATAISSPSTRRTSSSRREAATPAGTARIASVPSRTAATADLFDVRAANGGRRDRPADDPRDGDQREHVRQGLEQQLVGLPRLDEPEPLGERAREAEEERRGEGADRSPAAEDERGERDEAAAGGHVLGERVVEPDRQERAAERREHPRDDNGHVARAVDGDADRVGGLRVLADGADAEAGRRLEHRDVRERDGRDREPDHQVQRAERVSEEENVLQPAEVDVRDLGQVGRRPAVAVDVDVEVARDAEREEVD